MSSEGISNINFVNFSDEPNDEAEKYSEKQLITESGFFNKIQVKFSCPYCGNLISSRTPIDWKFTDFGQNGILCGFIIM